MFYPKSPFLRYPLVESHLLKRNTAALDDLLPWLCQAPCITTYRVNLLKTSVKAFQEYLEILLKEKYVHNPPKVYDIPLIPEVVVISKLPLPAPIELESNKQIIVDACCGAAILRGSHIYAPGVMAMETGTQKGEQVNVYADLEGKCKKGTNVRYESTQKVFLGVGKVLMQRYELFKPEGKVIQGVAIEMCANISKVPCLGDLSSSQALLQNLPSIVCVRVLNPQPGERIMDMCSSPGNKTTHIAEIMKDEGLIVALDKSDKKIAAVLEKIQTNDLESVQAYAWDATKCWDSNLQKFKCQPPFAADSFDRILVDAPCSALGNRPLLTSNMSPKTLASYVHVQRKLLENAVALLKPGGTLVYSTCTITEEENEVMVKWVLQKFPQMRLKDAVPRIGGHGLPGLGLNEEERTQVQRFSFGSNFDTVGFFISKFTKTP